MVAFGTPNNFLFEKEIAQYTNMYIHTYSLTHLLHENRLKEWTDWKWYETNEQMNDEHTNAYTHSLWKTVCFFFNVNSNLPGLFKITNILKTEKSTNKLANKWKSENCGNIIDSTPEHSMYIVNCINMCVCGNKVPKSISIDRKSVYYYQYKYSISVLRPFYHCHRSSYCHSVDSLFLLLLCVFGLYWSHFT